MSDRQFGARVTVVSGGVLAVLLLWWWLDPSAQWYLDMVSL